MKKKLFYVIEIQLQDVGDDIQEATGWKTITAYVIEGDDLKKFFDVECSRSDNSTEVIKDYLNDNGYGDENDSFELIQL